MDVFSQRCFSCNAIHPVRSSCNTPSCVERARERAIAAAGPRDAATEDSVRDAPLETLWSWINAGPYVAPADARRAPLDDMPLDPVHSGWTKGLVPGDRINLFPEATQPSRVDELRDLLAGSDADQARVTLSTCEKLCVDFVFNDCGTLRRYSATEGRAALMGMATSFRGRLIKLTPEQLAEASR